MPLSMGWIADGDRHYYWLGLDDRCEAEFAAILETFDYVPSQQPDESSSLAYKFAWVPI